jgi:hypothetical protein
MSPDCLSVKIIRNIFSVDIFHEVQESLGSTISMSRLLAGL